MNGLIFHCKICDFTQYKKIHLKAHKQTAHKLTAVNITWIECNFKTKKSYYLKNHKSAGHKPSKQVNDLLGMEDTIKFLKILFSHFSSQYSMEEDLELDDLKQENCKICKSNFQTEYGANTHQFCESGNSCNKRKFKQQNKDIFNKHKLNQRTFLYYCENCDSNHYKRIHLKKHKLNQRTFLCDFNISYECEKWTTKSKHYLRSHMEDEKNDAFDDLLNTPGEDS